jgi:hypothetical protein
MIKYLGLAIAFVGLCAAGAQNVVMTAHWQQDDKQAAPIISPPFDAVGPQPAPPRGTLKCPKYQHAVLRAPSGVCHGDDCAVREACIDDDHFLTESEYQALLARLAALEWLFSGHDDAPCSNCMVVKPVTTMPGAWYTSSAEHSACSVGGAMCMVDPMPDGHALTRWCSVGGQTFACNGTVILIVTPATAHASDAEKILGGKK